MTTAGSKTASTGEKLTIALLFGGRSSEHSVSCVTANSVYQSLDHSRYSVVPVGITKNGELVRVTPEELSQFSLDSEKLPEVPATGNRVVWPGSVSDHTLREVSDAGTLEPVAIIDVVLPMLHGPWGEDGSVQGMCEFINLPYVGSGVLSSALCMDKHTLKVVLAAAGIAVAPWNTVTQQQLDADPAIIRTLDAGLNYPLFVKPARAGSSVGVSRITDPSELGEAIAVALKEDHTVLIESGISGREVEIAVLENRDMRSLRASDCIGEIVFNGRDFYDFESKYLGAAGADVVLPADVTAEEYQAIRDEAFKAFRAAGCAVYARLDFFLTENGPVLNEINTLPGFTPISMYPKLWQQSGLGYSDLLTELIELARLTKR